jgi:hypothetical protein
MSITNTSKLPPIINLFETMGKGGIEAQEQRGQDELVRSEVLPAKGDWEELTKLGFVKGEPVNGDPLFVHAKLPAGWKKKGSDHAMWSYVLDEKGEERASIFYKAACYDRDAFISITK